MKNEIRESRDSHVIEWMANDWKEGLVCYVVSQSFSFFLFCFAFFVCVCVFVCLFVFYSELTSFVWYILLFQNFYLHIFHIIIIIIQCSGMLRSSGMFHVLVLSTD